MTHLLTDDLGAPVPLFDQPPTVVSLVPSITEAIATTLPSILVGATDYCTHPSTLEAKRVGGSKYPRVADVLALRPRLVVANAEENRPEDVHQLRANGIAVWVTRAAISVPDSIDSLQRLFADAFRIGTPDWLRAAEKAWRNVEPVRTRAIVPVWRRPWIVLGRDTFAGDVLRRIGIANVYADHDERYPRPALPELLDTLKRDKADLVVLPDEPYAFSAADGPESFPRTRCALVSGRHLTWYGPSLCEARTLLTAQCDQVT